MRIMLFSLLLTGCASNPLVYRCTQFRSPVENKHLFCKAQIAKEANLEDFETCHYVGNYTYVCSGDARGAHLDRSNQGDLTK